MKVKHIILLVILTGFFLAGIYVNTDRFISARDWKYDGGESIGDFLVVDNKYILLKWGSFYKMEKKFGTVFLCFGDFALFKSESTGKCGFYAAKGSPRLREWGFH